MYQRGVTLIELMVVVIIVGILAALAYPSYMEHVKRANRADAKTILLETTQFLERYYTENNTYVGATLPTSTSPKSGAKKYDIAYQAGSPTANTFVIEATPAGTMVGDACGTLSLSDAGVKGSAISIAECWNR